MTKKEMKKAYEKGELKPHAVCYTGIATVVIVNIEHGIEDRVQGYYIVVGTEKPVFFDRKINYKTVIPTFRISESTFVFNEFIRV